MLEDLDKIWSSDEPSIGFFESHRDGYRTLEICCMENLGGRFVKFLDYHSGSQQGHIRVPEGRKGRGWASFDGELRMFFLGMGLQSVYPGGHSSVLDKVVVGGHELGRKSRPLLLGVSHKSGDGVMSKVGIMDNRKGNVFYRLEFKQHTQPSVPLVEGGPWPTTHTEVSISMEIVGQNAPYY